MIVYIDNAFRRRKAAGKIRDLDDIIWAHMEGTVQRVRPKLMTVATMLIGLVPLLWAQGSGADVMKRIAAPMVGGLVTSAFLTLEIIPVIYTYWRQEQLLWELLEERKESHLLRWLRVPATVQSAGWGLLAVVLVSLIYVTLPVWLLVSGLRPGLARRPRRSHRLLRQPAGRAPVRLALTLAAERSNTMIRHVALALALSLGLAACAKKKEGPAAPPAARKVSDDPHRILIAVTEKGFEPDHISVKKGEANTLVFTRETEQTCAKEVVIAMSAGDPIRRDLPLHQEVAIPVTFPSSGDLRYACGMDMVSGVISVQ